MLLLLYVPYMNYGLPLVKKSTHDAEGRQPNRVVVMLGNRASSSVKRLAFIGDERCFLTRHHIIKKVAN